MNVKDALKLLNQVCSLYQGTLKEHKALQEALKTVEEATKPKKSK